MAKRYYESSNIEIESYYENGNVAFITSYKNCHPEGIRKEYNEDGILKSESIRHNGKRVKNLGPNGAK